MTLAAVPKAAGASGNNRSQAPPRNGGVFECAFRADDGISLSAVESAMGYPPGGMPEPVAELCGKLLPEALEKSRPSGGYRIVSLEAGRRGRPVIVLGGETLEVGKIILGQLARADSAAVFVCTAGPLLEAWARDLMASGETVMGYVVDAMASEIAEHIAGRLQDELERRARGMGKGITSRFSPGYCGWPVAQQRVLFSLLPEKFCGVSLLPSSLMIPVKSVSGIIGIGRGAGRADYPCRFCGMENCFKRRAAAGTA